MRPLLTLFVETLREHTSPVFFARILKSLAEALDARLVEALLRTKRAARTAEHFGREATALQNHVLALGRLKGGGVASTRLVAAVKDGQEHVQGVLELLNASGTTLANVLATSKLSLTKVQRVLLKTF